MPAGTAVKDPKAFAMKCFCAPCMVWKDNGGKWDDKHFLITACCCWWCWPAAGIYANFFWKK
mgnify:CR=1 FL=1